MRLKASDRRTIIEDLLDIEIFSVMNYLLKGRVAQNKDNMGAVDISLGLSRGEREHLEFLINKLKEDKSVQINKNEKDIKEHEKFLKNYKKNINDFINKNKTLSESISDQAKVREKVNTLFDYERGIEKNIMKFEDEIEFYENNETCGVCRQNIPKNFRKEMIEDFHTKMHQSGQAILKLGLDLHEQNKRIKEIDDVLDIMKEHDINATRDQNSLEACVQYIEKVTKLNKELFQMTEDIDQKRKDLDLLKNDIDIYNEEKEELSKQRHLYETAATLLKDTGIKTRIIKQYLPIINKLINVHLGKLDFYVSFELDESFNETIKSRYRDEFTYDSFSEGEKMRIDLALLFTWRAVAKLKNSVNTNLLVLDEVFDSSLDAAGTDEFLKILNDLAGDVNTFVISHKGEILFDKFNKVIKFEKHKNFSRIVS
jgi:hypothetical protein